MLRIVIGEKSSCFQSSSLTLLDSHKQLDTIYVCFVCFVVSLILDNERWKQADVPTELQSLVDSLVDGKTYLKFSLLWFIVFLRIPINFFLQKCSLILIVFIRCIPTG